LGIRLGGVKGGFALNKRIGDVAKNPVSPRPIAGKFFVRINVHAK